MVNCRIVPPDESSSLKCVVEDPIRSAEKESGVTTLHSPVQEGHDRKAEFVRRLKNVGPWAVGSAAAPRMRRPSRRNHLHGIFVARFGEVCVYVYPYKYGCAVICDGLPFGMEDCP